MNLGDLILEALAEGEDKIEIDGDAGYMTLYSDGTLHVIQEDPTDHRQREDAMIEIGDDGMQTLHDWLMNRVSAGRSMQEEVSGEQDATTLFPLALNSLQNLVTAVKRTQPRMAKELAVMLHSLKAMEDNFVAKALTGEGKGSGHPEDVKKRAEELHGKEGFKGKEGKSKAFAIAYSQKKKGHKMPTESELEEIIKEEMENILETSDKTYPTYERLLQLLGAEVLLESLIRISDKETLKENFKYIARHNDIKTVPEVNTSLEQSVGARVKHLKKKK